MIQINRLSIEDAKTLTDGARAKAREIGVPMCIAITDESGNLISFERMNGGKITSVIIAQDKAFTAAARVRQRTNTTRRASPATWSSGFTPPSVAECALWEAGFPWP